MKYKVGDKVQIKSLEWYNENKDDLDQVKCSDYIFTHPMTKYCGKTVTIKCINTKDCYYLISEDDGYRSWTDEMIKCKVEENKLMDLVEHRSLKPEIILPEGYIFKDENGNIINATKIVLEKKKNEYPKTYEECAEIIAELTGSDCNPKGCMGYMSVQLTALQKLLICRDAYWKIAGQEMGLDDPWEPDYSGTFENGTPIKYVIYNIGTHIVKERKSSPNHILSFPTEEMGSAFYENFKNEIESCKELL